MPWSILAREKRLNLSLLQRAITGRVNLHDIGQIRRCLGFWKSWISFGEIALNSAKIKRKIEQGKNGKINEIKIIISVLNYLFPLIVNFFINYSQVKLVFFIQNCQVEFFLFIKNCQDEFFLFIKNCQVDLLSGIHFFLINWLFYRNFNIFQVL